MTGFSVRIRPSTLALFVVMAMASTLLLFHNFSRFLLVDDSLARSISERSSANASATACRGRFRSEPLRALIHFHVPKAAGSALA